MKKSLRRVFFMLATTSNLLSSAEEISTWDFYTKYLANAYDFTASYYESRANDNNYGRGLSYNWDNHKYLEIAKTHWELTPESKKEGSNFQVNGDIEIASVFLDLAYGLDERTPFKYTNRQYIEIFEDAKKRVTLQGSNFGEVYCYGLSTCLSIPVLTDNNIINFTHHKDIANNFWTNFYFNRWEDHFIQLPEWELKSTYRPLNLTMKVGELYQFDCDFQSYNLNHNIEYHNSPSFNYENFAPKFNRLELKIKPEQLMTQDEYGEWQWDNSHTHIWLESKGKGILNQSPISFNIIKVRGINKTRLEQEDMLAGGLNENELVEYLPARYNTSFELSLIGDFLSELGPRSILEDGTKIYEINFNFGEGNIPLTFSTRSTLKMDDQTMITYVKYDRFKNSFNSDSKSILDQIKEHDYCVMTLVNKNGVTQSYVYHLEGLSVILENL